jgi:undecaprenyl-diphosphatase
MELLIKAFIMGIVEGLTEFIPVSSTGHLILVGNFINFTGKFATMFEIVIQLGAILAVVYYFRNKIFSSFKALKPGEWGFNLWYKMFIAVLPAGIVGVLTHHYIEEHLFSPFTVSIALIVGAILMIVVEDIFGKRYKIDNMDKVDATGAFLIGVFQVMSLFPGMSRSASTIIGGMVMGLSVKAAAEFSFFLAIPTMLAATGFELLKNITAMSLLEWEALIVGFITSFISALIVVDKFLTYLRRHALKPFAYYRLGVGILMLFLITQKLITIK